MKTNKSVKLLFAVTVVGPLFSATTAAAEKAPLTPAYQSLPLGEIRPQGWIRAQMDNDLQRGVAGNFQKYRPAYSSGTWVKKDGDAGKAEMTGHWLDGFLRMAHYTGREEALARVRGFVDDILGAQEPDGYVSNLPADKRWRRLNRDLFNDSTTCSALLTHYELTGDRRALDAVKAHTALVMSNYTAMNRPFAFMPGDEAYAEARDEAPDDLVDEPAAGRKKKKRPNINGHSLMFVDVCESLHRLTGDQTYVDYAAFLYDDYSSSDDVKPDDVKIASLLDPDQPFTGHAAHVAEQLRVPLFLAFHGGDDPLPRVAHAAFVKLERYLVPSGALAGDEGIHDLPPLPVQGYEFCTTTQLARSLASALQKTGKMDFADKIEWLVFNAGQGARTADGTKIAYLSASTLTQALEKMPLRYPHNGNGRWQYSPAHQVGGSCCTATAVQMLPHYVGSMWMKTGDGGLAACLLGPSQVTTEIAGTKVQIEEVTDYPFSDTVTFRFSLPRPVRFPLHVRIPSWAGRVKLTADGAKITGATDRRILEKEWCDGDTVTLEFENPVGLRPCVNDERIVHRGPFLYALPLAAETKVLKKSRPGVPEFEEWELRSAGPKSAADLFLDATRPDAGFRAEVNPGYDPAMPWAEPQKLLVGKLHTAADGSGDTQTATLRPMGSTLLRRAAFPVKSSANKR
jgi:hypothetical protein